jgi:xanthine dehydrogenase accessory factor
MINKDKFRMGFLLADILILPYNNFVMLLTPITCSKVNYILPHASLLHPEYPMRALSDDRILNLAAEWYESGHDLAIAVVIQTWGSSPRPTGSDMIIRDDDQIEGSVSGGCVESAVIEAAHDVMASATSKQLDFHVVDEEAWQVGLSCGGAISVWICAASSMTDSASHLFTHITSQCSKRNAIAIDCHISQHLAPMAIEAGFDVTVIDPRTFFINEDRFPEPALIHDWPDESLVAAALDKDTAVVTLSHDPKLDDAALQIALQSPVFYIASLGSHRTHIKRCERLRQNGFNDEQLA